MIRVRGGGVVGWGGGASISVAQGLASEWPSTTGALRAHATLMSLVEFAPDYFPKVTSRAWTSPRVYATLLASNPRMQGRSTGHEPQSSPHTASPTPAGLRLPATAVQPQRSPGAATGVNQSNQTAPVSDSPAFDWMYLHPIKAIKHPKLRRHPHPLSPNLHRPKNKPQTQSNPQSNLPGQELPHTKVPNELSQRSGDPAKQDPKRSPKTKNCETFAHLFPSVDNPVRPPRPLRLCGEPRTGLTTPPPLPYYPHRTGV